MKKKLFFFTVLVFAFLLALAIGTNAKVYKAGDDVTAAEIAVGDFILKGARVNLGGSNSATIQDIATIQAEGTCVWTSAKDYVVTTSELAQQNGWLLVLSETPSRSITYHLDGGFIHQKDYPQSFVDDMLVNLPSDVAKTGYKFLGWYLDSQFQGEPIESFNDEGSDVDVYAKWESCASEDMALTVGKLTVGTTKEQLLSKITGLPSGVKIIDLLIYSNSFSFETSISADTYAVYVVFEKENGDPFYYLKPKSTEFTFDGTLTVDGEAPFFTVIGSYGGNGQFLETVTANGAINIAIAWTVSLEKEIKIDSVSMTLEKNLTLNFKMDLTEISDLTNCAMDVSFNGKEWTITDPEDDGAYLIFSVKDILPEYMGFDVTVDFYGTDGNSKVVHAKELSYSVQDYCENQLEDMDYEDGYLSALLVDTLNYGSAAQIYRNVNTSKLVNANLGEKADWASEAEPYNSVLEVENGSTVSVVGADLVYGNTVALRFAIYAPNPNVLTFKFYESDTFQSVELDDPLYTVSGTDIVDDIVVSPAGGMYYLVTFDQFNAAQMFENYLMVVMQGDTEMASVIYSVESYAAEKFDVETNAEYNIYDDDVENLGQLIDAMMKYGRSAHKYDMAG